MALLKSNSFASGTSSGWDAANLTGSGATQVFNDASSDRDSNGFGATFHNPASTSTTNNLQWTGLSAPASQQFWLLAQVNFVTSSWAGVARLLELRAESPVFNYIAQVINNGGTWSLQLRNKDATITTVNFTTSPTANTWHTIKLSYNWAGANPVATASVDGTVQATATDTTTGTLRVPATAQLGADETSFANAFDVRADVATLYDLDPQGALAFIAAANGVVTLTGGITLNPVPALMLVADDIAQADMSYVATWSDTSGNARHATQAGAVTAKPLLRTAVNGLNGHAGVRFSGAQSLATTSFLGAGFDTAFSLYVVFYRATGADMVVVDNGNGLLNVEFQANEAAGALLMTPAGAVGSGALKVNASGITIPSGSQRDVCPQGDLVVMGFVYDGALYTVSANGNESTQRAKGNHSGTGNLGLTGALTIGGRADATLPFSGYICEVQLYPGAHSDSVRRAKTLALRQKYGVVPARSVVCIGDSLTFGQALTTPETQSYPGQLVSGLTHPAGVYNLGIGGTSSGDWINTHLPSLVNPFALSDRTQPIVVVWLGHNDGNAAISETNLAAIGDALRALGYKTILVPVVQSTTGVAAYDTLYTWMLANWASHFDRFADIRLLPMFSATAAGAAVQCADTIYYQGDQIHLTQEGYRPIAGVVKTEVDALWSSVITGVAMTATPNTVVLGGTVLLTIDEPTAFWLSAPPSLSVSGGTGASLGAPTVVSNTQLTVVLTPGSAAAILTIADATTSGLAAITAIAAATTYTFSGPNNGVNGLENGDFIVELLPNTGVPVAVTITPSDGGAGGVWTPATAVIPPNTAGASDTLRYTPTQNVTVTLSTTNNGSLTNPAPLTYVVGTTVQGGGSILVFKG